MQPQGSGVKKNKYMFGLAPPSYMSWCFFLVGDFFVAKVVKGKYDN